MLCLTFGTLTHLLWTNIFVVKFQLGITGTGIALIITNTIIFVSQILYSIYWIPEIAICNQWPDSRSYNFEGIKSYMRIGLPSMVMTCLDWWVFELMVLASSWLFVYGISDDQVTD